MSSSRMRKRLREEFRGRGIFITASISRFVKSDRVVGDIQSFIPTLSRVPTVVAVHPW